MQGKRFGIESDIAFTLVSVRLLLTQNKAVQNDSIVYGRLSRVFLQCNDPYNFFQLYIECVDVDKDFQQQKQNAIITRSRSPRKSASDELKENSTNNFKKENVYQAYNDIENNELTLFNESLSRSGNSFVLIEYVIYIQRVLSMRCLKDTLYALLEVSKTSFICYRCLKNISCIPYGCHECL